MSEEKATIVEDVVVTTPTVEATNASENKDFDWDAYAEGGHAMYSKTEAAEYETMYEATLPEETQAGVIDGVVLNLTDREAIITIGGKSEGVISLNEFRYNPELTVGDTVEVLIDQQEDKTGQLVLSHRKARSIRSWDRVNAAHDNEEIVNGFVKCRTKGGMIVDVFGIEAFLPGSQIDVKPIRDYDIYVGKTMEFKVVKINEVYKNVVISHKALIEDDIEAQKAEMISKMEVGQVLEGTVKNMTSFGVFVDLGGLDGLLHITDISWGRINHPEDVLALDQKIQVAVLEFDNEKKRISLGMKQLTAHPWDSMKELKEGEKVNGKVVTVADYGAFVEIEPGVEGLIHVSEMSWSQHLRNPSDFIKVGDEVEAVILDIDKEEHKLSLGLKQLSSDPWDKIEEKYPMDSKHTGIVRNLTNYGLFVELEEGVDGLVHVSDLSWSKKIKHPAEFTKKGEELEIVVLEIDRDNRRLSLGHKQIDENPWDTFASVFTLGSEHEGVVSEINDRGIILTLPYGVEGFAPKKHVKKEDGTELKMDETIAVRVIEFNKDAKRILVSHTDIWKEAERAQNSEQQADTRRKSANTNKYVEKMNKGAERSTLGELDVLANLKAQMEASPAKKAATKKETPKKETAKKEAAPKKEAEVVAPAAEEEVVESTTDAPASDLASMTVAQLKAAAKDKGITGYTTLKKAELLEVLSK